ncbi:MAG: hypothetical protein HRT93_03110 [Piscirickettsiaceae bacterium]|nr:hypothetical protein [Piscirickettsiaceae bacterium]
MSLQKLRILELGFNHLTGVAGGIEFKDGLSIEAVTKTQAFRLSAAMRCEFENGGNSSPANVVIENANMPAPSTAEVTLPVVESTADGEDNRTGVEKYIQKMNSQAPKESVKTAKYTREQLEVVADEKGIVGVREIAGEFGAKSNSIAGLIDAIVTAQG